MRAWIVCPFCGEEIDLRDKKDFESFSQIEALQHYEMDHPVILDDRTMMPYTRVQFEFERNDEQPYQGTS